ncbi:hypothetical protein J132_08608 [Termitomyces sp. J132]|nr:hypothetical protein C0989_007793 [Termitomyces sp. Mn162]KAH0584243.1 hypothetical protein H2248_009795 [Termitomyces sp. 'cryptogamus']KNZ71552.1 hypothetical protein J132_08608 [Termitomyces sp. J132]
MLNKIKDLDDWIAMVASIDNTLQDQQRQFQDMLKAAKVEAATTDANKKFQPKASSTISSTPLTTSNNANMTSSLTPTNALDGPKAQKYVYPLTDMEHLLLLNHEGCTKCQKFYVENDHTHNNFPQDKLLLPATYKTLTLEMVKAAKYSYIMQGGKLKNMGKETLIAMVVVNSTISD